jgi:hypothetical protein
MLLVGWKSICKAVDSVCEDTLRKWIKEEGFPVTMLARTPVTTNNAIEMWIEQKILSTKKSPNKAPS